jgi:hypothetical protein
MDDLEAHRIELGLVVDKQKLLRIVGRIVERRPETGRARADGDAEPSGEVGIFARV